MTIKDILEKAAMESPDGTALRFKRGGAWQTLSFSELLERAWHVAQMLVRLGVQAGDRVAICQGNSPEWFELYHGIVGMGAIAVPVDVKLRQMEAAHIFHDCRVSVAFCSSRYTKTFQDFDAPLPKVVVVDFDEMALPMQTRIEYFDYNGLWRKVSAEAMSAGRAYDLHDPSENSVASLIYTSGTTGQPKGAMLTHGNFISDVTGIWSEFEISKTENFLLVLPLHHSFAFTTTLLLPVYAQCQVSLVENLKTIKTDMVETRPTVLIAVPLLLEKMMDRIHKKINGKALARLMYRRGLVKIVGRKIHRELGGSLRLIVSGGAPIRPGILNAWMKLGFNIIEGYGITETSPVLTINPPAAPRVGTVGLPIQGVEIKIANPNAEGIGEIIVRGENVMRGYYNNPEETQRVLRNGWYYSGDLGYFDKKGYLIISGRKKNMIVNREGKNIYPEEIEQQVLKSEFVLECIAFGYPESHDEYGERVGLIVVPNMEVIETIEMNTGQRPARHEIEQIVRDDIREKLQYLSDFKRPRKVLFRFEEFEKNTSRKIKRYLYVNV